MTVLGVDTSNYTGDLSSQQAQELAAAGITRAIVACQFPDVFRQQLDALTAEGIACDAYLYLYNTDKGSYLDQTRAAIETVTGKPIHRLWLDLEDEELPFVRDIEADITDSIAAVRAAGIGVGIYSGAWWWQRYIASFKPGPGVRLWDANYDGNPDDFTVSYGGWTYSSVKQYQGGATIGSVANIDLDSFSD
jgi:hypothetical protein